MARRISSNTVRTVGALLPSDVLSKAMDGKGLDGLELEDYGLQEDQRFRDVVNDAWNEARSLWWSFQAGLRDLPKEDASASSLTREKWLIPLLELLGFDHVEVESRSLVVSGTEYPISHSRNGTPLHLMGARVDLDGRVSGIPGAARLSPHSLLQQFLNRSDDHLWGLVSNGLQLRILRDSVSLTRQAFVQFDLEALFNGEVFPDFVLLYRVVHATRFNGERPEDCLLERWIAAARDEGIRALDQLRDGVEVALTELGSGFLSHPNNSQLRKMVAEEDLDPRGMYRYLLRLVYRLLFLFVAEDRDLLLVPETDPVARDRFDRFYSTARIRDLASRQTTPGHVDLWAGLGVLMNILGKDEGEPGLGLPGLGSFLWDFDAIGPLIESDIDNDRLLEAIRSLAYVRESGTLRRIDFAALGAEELGSVYESLLELHPAMDEEQRSFSLGEGAGSERKTTGSYYTPTELISELLDSALDPVLEEAVGKEDPEVAILNLKVVDPAAGSGHFLVAAAHRIAKRLAEIRTGEPEPPEEEYRTAVRDVVSRCLFAVDINDLAVELCKVSLWLEALEPGKPLSFLDHHILHGNSLFGATPAAIAAGIPNDAFVALTGDDKRVVSALKKRNREERGGQEELSFDSDEAAFIGEELKVLEGYDDSDLQTVRAKEKILVAWKSSKEYEHAKLVADAWCAAFAVEKSPGAPKLTDGVFRRLRDDGKVDSELQDVVEHLADRHRFFHWHLGFPQIFDVNDEGFTEGPGWRGGFDVVLANPPWERVKIQEIEWFSTRYPSVAAAPNKAARGRAIRALEEAEPGTPEADVWIDWQGALRTAAVYSHFLRRGGVYPLGGVGDVNLYAVFADLFRQILAGRGRAGFVCPTGLATGATYAPFLAYLLETERLQAFFGFENEALLFPSITNKVKFALVTITGTGVKTRDIAFTGYVSRARSIHDPEFFYRLDRSAIESINPNSSTVPLFRYSRDAGITASIHGRVPVLIDGKSGANPWQVAYLSMFHMANDSEHFESAPDLSSIAGRRPGHVFELEGGRTVLPLYEGKMIWLYDHRYGTYEGQTQKQANKQVLPHSSDKQHSDPEFYALPRYWMDARLVDDRMLGRPDPGWLLSFRDVGPKERTMVPSVIPRTAVGHSASVLLSSEAAGSQAFLVAQLSSFVVDYALRQKGTSRMTRYIIEQAPVLPPSVTADPMPWGTGTVGGFVVPRVVELIYTAWDVRSFSAECGLDGAPFKWDPERRQYLSAEVDAVLFHLFEVDRPSVEHIMETFGLTRSKDEAKHGSYRTKELILAVYDRVSRAIESGVPYETALEPAPAHPSLRVHPGAST